MRIASQLGRLVIVQGDETMDVERASDATFSAAPAAIFAVWQEFTEWASRTAFSPDGRIDPAALGAPSPEPRQIFAIGLNYRSHAAESGIAVPEHPVVFTKFASSVAGPTASIEVPADTVDYEAELVAVIGRGGHRIAEEDAWDHVAGLTIGQDISERTTQLRGPAPHFDLGKSFPNFSPMGPVLVTPDEFADRSSLRLTTEIIDPDGSTRKLQDGNTRDLIFSIPDLIARLSQIITLIPGDVIFTGTPEGVGMGRDPKAFLRIGQTLVTTIEGIGEMRNSIV